MAHIHHGVLGTHHTTPHERCTSRALTSWLGLLQRREYPSGRLTARRGAAAGGTARAAGGVGSATHRTRRHRSRGRRVVERTRVAPRAGGGAAAAARRVLVGACGQRQVDADGSLLQQQLPVQAPRALPRCAAWHPTSCLKGVSTYYYELCPSPLCVVGNAGVRVNGCGVRGARCARTRG